jgi:hypothetical protein
MLARFKATSGAAVTLQRLGGPLERSLDLGVKFFVFKLLVRNPLGSSDQGWLALQMLGKQSAGVTVTLRFAQRDDGIEHIQ